MPEFTKGQWPDNICSGGIRYGKASNYDGFYLADASHGIPTFGSVADDSPATIRGQHVKVFNYPGQTEAIAAQLVHRWNMHRRLVTALREAVDFANKANNYIAGQNLPTAVEWLNIIAEAEGTTNDN